MIRNIDKVNQLNPDAMSVADPCTLQLSITISAVDCLSPIHSHSTIFANSFPSILLIKPMIKFCYQMSKGIQT